MAYLNRNGITINKAGELKLSLVGNNATGVVAETSVYEMTDVQLTMFINEYMQRSLEIGELPTYSGLALALGESSHSLDDFIVSAGINNKTKLLVHAKDMMDDYIFHAYINGIGQKSAIKDYLQNVHSWSNKVSGEKALENSGGEAKRAFAIVDDLQVVNQINRDERRKDETKERMLEAQKTLEANHEH